MTDERIIVMAKQKKQLKNLASLLSGLGFTKIAFMRNVLSVEKVKGSDLQGKPYLEYKIEFKPNSVEFIYSYSAKRGKLARLLDLMPTFLNILQVADEYYEIKSSSMFSNIVAVLAETSKIVDRDAMEFSTQLTELKTKHEDLLARYDDLVRSSETNTRLLLECERKRDELDKKLAQMTGMSDDLLKESLYNWIKVHGGTIDLRDFAKANAVAISRVEDGLNILIRDGYIKRRFE
jgi:hypothetical protein